MIYLLLILLIPSGAVASAYIFFRLWSSWVRGDTFKIPMVYLQHPKSFVYPLSFIIFGISYYFWMSAVKNLLIPLIIVPITIGFLYMTNK
jgi:hypothetical protein